MPRKALKHVVLPWTYCELGEVVLLRSGGTPSKLIHAYWDGDVPWFTARDLKELHLTDSYFHLSELGVENGTTVVDKGVVFILVRGMTLLKDVPIGVTTRRCAFNQDIKALLAKEGFSPEFLAAYLVYSKAELMRLVSRAGHGTGRLATDALTSFPVPVLSIGEQGRVTRVLDSWNKRIRLAERMLALKERRKRALMQQLLTGRRRFSEFVKSQKERSTRFGARPLDWPIVEIGDIACEVSERAGSNESSPVFSCTKAAGLVPSLEYFGKRVFSEDTSAYKKVRKGQFAYATNHLEEGSIGLLKHSVVGLVSPMYTVFQTSPAVNATFLYALFKTDLYRHIFEVYTSSSVDRRGSLRWNEFKKIHVALPPLEEQCRVVSLIDTCDREIRQATNEIECLKRQKRGLMRKLLTGQVRIPLSRMEM